MKKEVSCRIIQAVLEYTGKLHVPPGQVCEGIPYSLGYLNDKQNRVEWEVYRTMMANLRSIWTDDDFVRMGFELLYASSFKILRSLGRLLFRGTEAYEWWTSGARSAGTQLFSCVTGTLEHVGENHLVLTLTLAPGYVYCRDFFLITTGSMKAGTVAIGLPPARVEMTETERGAIYDIHCPDGGGALAWLRRTVTWPSVVRNAARELKDANQALLERHAQLEEARERLERQATQLKVAYDISRLIRANVDLDATLESIVRSLVTVAGFSAAEVSLDAATEEDHIVRHVSTGDGPSGVEFVSRVLEGHGRILGSVRLWTHPGADPAESDDLLDYVIPTIAMEIDDAISFRLLNDLRDSLQRKVDERTQELNEMNRTLTKAQSGRDRLFSNISHEFRTPLTLILGPLEKVLEETRDASIRRRLAMMKKNAGKLLRLINQLLDLSRLQSGDVKLAASEFDLVPFLRGVVMSYRSLAVSRHIRLTFRAGRGSIRIYLDREKAETLFNNLLVNAFKYTPDGGRIDVSLRTGGNAVDVSIRDSGVGIPEDELPFIFDRFYQGSSSGDLNIGGTGIGLALAKELAELHHGTVRASSTMGLGTEFVVSLPLGRAHLGDSDLLAKNAPAPSGDAPGPPEPEGLPGFGRDAGKKSPAGRDMSEGKRVVLVIDDDRDVRQYVNDILSPEMQVVESGDGDEGIRRAQEMIPDLIVSDIVMPCRDGNEVCRTLKNDVRTSHIPVILLTAKAGTENRIEGLQGGADDYVVKPFVARELLARVRNLIALRESLRKRYASERLLSSSKSRGSSLENAFLQKAIEIVERHLGDDGFGIDDFSREIGLSRTQLHRKLVALTDCSARDFLRRLRLERASEMLQKNAGNVSEIAYRVGFRDPSHFARCFRKQFGVPPGAVRPAIRS